MGRGRLIEILRGPRQVGKTTGLYQIIQTLLGEGVAPTDILLVRFELEILREVEGGLPAILRWFAAEVRGPPLERGARPYVFLDEIHKLARWDEQVKHVGDTFPLRVLLTGSSSVLVARGGRESLAGRTFSTELPPFSFREVVDAWSPRLARRLPPVLPLGQLFEAPSLETLDAVARLKGQTLRALRRRLDRYYNRGGYPRLHSGDVHDDVWTDYLIQTIFESVLGADIPSLFPIQHPGLLRHLYLSVARLTGQEVTQVKLVETAKQAGYSATQPTVGKYLHHLADALLIREFRRFPLAKRSSARVPAKLTLTDLGVRNAIFRGAPSLWESDPGVVGPLVETLVQAVLRGKGLQVHFWRDYEMPGNRRSRIHEVDFVVERVDGALLPIEVKFRRRIDAEDTIGLRMFMERYPAAPHGILVTRDTSGRRAKGRILCVPLLHFLLAL